MADINLIDVPVMDWPAAVTSITNSPPGGPSLNTCHIVGTSGTGAFSGHNNALARWNDSAAWEFKTPFNGQTVYNVATTSYVKWNGSAWVASSTASLQGAYDGGNTIALVTGTDISVANSSDTLLAIGSVATLKSKDQATAGAAGNAVNITGGTGGAAAPAGIPGTGGIVTISAGTKGSEAASPGGTIGGVAGNHLNLLGGSGGDSSGSKAGCVIIEGGQVGTGVAGGTNVPGDVRIGQNANKTHTVRIGQSSTGTPVEVKGPLWTPLTTLTDGATVTVTLGKGNTFIVTLGGNRTLDFSFPNSFSNSTVDPAGISGVLIVKQDGTGSRTLGFAAKVKTSGDTSLNSAAAAYTVFRFTVEDASNVHLRKVEGSTGGASLTSNAPADVTVAAAAVGVGTAAARDDHKHNISTGAPSTLVVGGSNTTGSASSVSKSDHVHALPAFGTSAGTFMEGNATPTAAALKSATTTVTVSAATAPTTGQVLTAINSTSASWQTAAGGAASDLGTSGANVNVNAAAPPSTGQVLTATDATHATWQTPGAATSSNMLSDIPSSPNADDEEWGSTTPPAAWELYNHTDSVTITPSGSIDPYSALTANDTARLKTHTDWHKSFVSIQVSTEGSSKNYTYSKAVTVPTNRLIWSRLAFSMRFTETSAVAGNFGLGFFADASGHASLSDSVVFYFDGLTSSTQGLKATKTAATVFSTITTGPNVLGGTGIAWDYLGIHKVGTTYHFWTFNDGGHKMYWGSTTHAATMARIGFFIRDGNSASPGNAIVGADFVRNIDSATQLPC